MKIAIFHELDFGGARRTVDEFAKRLNQIFDIDLYYLDDKEEINIKNRYKNVYYYPFYPKSWKGNNWKTRLYKDTVELFKLYGLHKKIANDIKLKNYDYVFVHPSKYTQAPFLLKFLENCIYYCQEPLRIVYDPLVSDIYRIKFPKNMYEFINRRIRKWIDKENFKNARVVLSNSKFSKHTIEKSYGKSAEVCYLGVDENFFKPLDIKKTIDVLFIGNRDDGYALLNKLPSYFDNIINIYTIFRGNGSMKVTDMRLVEIYNRSKVLVALNHNEPFGLIPLEAMACGTPVIAVDEGGYKESIAENITGFLIPRDSNKLHKKIKEILGNDRLRSNMAKAAREYILKNWTWDKSVQRLLQIIKNFDAYEKC
jgi:glycosyltransferase involved in cell wall biosynthesis